MLLGPFFIRTRKLIGKLNERFGDILFFTSQDQITMSGLKTNKRENQYTRLLGSGNLLLPISVRERETEMDLINFLHIFT